jgi:hypothetical protein
MDPSIAFSFSSLTGTASDHGDPIAAVWDNEDDSGAPEPDWQVVERKKHNKADIESRSGPGAFILKNLATLDHP